MRRSAPFVQKEAEPENDAQMEPKVKQSRLEERISKIAALDNATKLEIFKHLNYMQLAKSSLVSKRFSNLIRTHRHKLAMLNVDIFRVTHDNVTQHFVCLLTDPFVFINHLQLTADIDLSFLNLLSGAMNQGNSRLQCNLLELWNTNPEDNMPKFIKWIKDHVRCNKFIIVGDQNLNYKEELLDYFMTGANSTCEICVGFCDLSEVVVDFVKKFMDLESCDECQLVQSISGHVSKSNVQALIHAEFIGNEEQNDSEYSTEQIFEFVNADTVQIFEFDNDDIGKKVQLAFANPLKVSVKITNL